jgi:hypothetical protein
MTTETGITIISPRSLTEAKELASTLAGARTIPEALQKSPADVLAIVMAGAELGLAPMQSVRALVLIKGKPTLSADAMGALVKSRRDVCQFLMLRHSDGTKATYETQRVGDPAPTTMSFTIEEAKAAGLAGNDNWRKFPAAMLRARALSAICRAVYSDLILGVYDPDELAPDAPKPQVEREVNAAPVIVEAPPASPPVVAEVVAAAPPSPPRKHAFVDAPPAEADPITLEVLALRAAIERATSEAELSALVPRITALPAKDKATVRVAWGAKRDALRGGK